MKYILVFFILMFTYSCNDKSRQITNLNKKMDSLEFVIKNSYKPSFGELMNSVQVHHEKLWFAGINKNWKLADFEIHEIIEALENIKKYQSHRNETQYIDMLNPILNLIKTSIKKQNRQLFDTYYINLTNTCNDCHKITDFEFNIVKIPNTNRFNNQEFKINPLN